MAGSLASDRFITFGKKKPTRRQIKLLLEDFLNGVVKEIRWDEDRFFVILPGLTSNPLGRVVGGKRARVLCAFDGDIRGMEIIPQGRTLDVLTRHQDDFVHALCDQIVDIIVRYWGGKKGLGGEDED